MICGRWTAKGYTLLLEYGIRSDTDYYHVTSQLAASGAPAILLVGNTEDLSLLWNSFDDNPRLSSPEVVFIGVDGWTGIIDNLTLSMSRKGMIGLTLGQSKSALATKFLSYWESLDPIIYPDSDGNRLQIELYTSYIIDSIIALSLAYQEAIIDNTGLQGELFRSYVYEAITELSFEGISGTKTFDAYGDQLRPSYDILMTHNNQLGNEQWIKVGTIDSVSINLHMNLIIWPDGSSGETSGYSSLLEPFCPPGAEPTVRSGVPFCSECDIGFYKPDYGSDSCTPCPTGTDCEALGTVIPCPLPGFWRKQPPDDQLANFHKYGVYSCDVPEKCLGGCNLTNSCIENRLQTSPTCGVCIDGYYLSAGKCLPCDNMSETLSISMYFLQLFLLFLLLSAFLRYQISFDNFSYDSEFVERSQQSSFFHLHLNSFSSLSLLFSAGYFAALKIVISKSSVTFKLIVSFWQILTAAFYNISVEWPPSLRLLLNAVALDPFAFVSQSSTCLASDVSTPFIILLLTFLFPLIFLVLLGLAVLTLYVVVIRPHYKKLETQSIPQHAHRWINDTLYGLWEACSKIIVWFCFIMFAQGSNTMISFLNCRDLGAAGIFLRSDYSISCESDIYSAYSILALFGILVFPVGISCLFFFIIKYRNHPRIRSCATLLCSNFDDNWLYFEVYDLQRKLLLTSILVFVGSPASTIRPLYLFTVDLFSLLLLCYCRPYAHTNDDILSIIFHVIECIGFFIIFLLSSGLDNHSDVYHVNSVFESLLLVTLVTFVLIVPLSFLLKFDSIRVHMIERFRTLLSSLKESESSTKLKNDQTFLSTEIELTNTDNPIARKINESVD